ncbi:unnamed protein product, partial [Meganyctiphanes norvegica]
MEQGLVNLRAELHKKRQEVNKFDSAQKGFKKLQKEKKEKTLFERNNVGVSSRNDNDLQQIEEERPTENKAREILEKKAALYEKINSGINVLEDDELNERFLVNFQKKIVTDVLDKKRQREELQKHREKEEKEKEDSQKQREAKHPNLYEAPSDQYEWVEYTDALGRTRECMKKDLPNMRQMDKDLLGKDEEKETESKEDDAATASEDIARELQHQRWARQEAINATKKDIHYQDVLFDEKRAHGVGFMKFSSDGETRAAQMKHLNELHEESKTLQSQAATAAAKKDKAMKLRLEKVRQKKRLKMGLPMEGSMEDRLKTPPVSDDEEEVGSHLPTISLPPDPMPNKDPPAVREWDLGKAELQGMLSQEQWIDRQRKNRYEEFAPPTLYEPNKKAKKVKNEVSSDIPKAFPPPSLYGNEQQQLGPSHESSSNEYREVRKSEFAPPPTFEYYGPSGVRSKQPRTGKLYNDFDQSLNEKISYFRNNP